MLDTSRHGDWLVYCDRCSREVWASEARHEWTGLIVCPEDYDVRHPQELVRGRADRQNVPFSRPEPDDTFIAPFSTTLTADEAAGQTTLSVASTTNFTSGNYIHIAMNDGSVFRSTIASIGGATSVTIDDALPSLASSGNTVTDIGVAP